MVNHNESYRDEADDEPGKLSQNSPVTAELVALQVFGAREYCHDGTPEVLAHHSLTVDGWSVSVTTGQVTPLAWQALATSDPLLTAANRVSRGEYGLLLTQADPAPWDTDIATEIAEYSIPHEWRDPNRICTTIELRRTIEIGPNRRSGNGLYFWYDPTEIRVLATRYEEPRAKIIGWIAARISVPDLDLFYYQYAPPRFFILSAGKPIQSVILAGPRDIHMTTGYSNADAQRRLAKSAGLAAVGKPSSLVGVWLINAAGEEDHFKRFLWSYVGLEIITGAMARKTRDSFIRDINLAKGGVGLEPSVMKELLWPASGDKGYPDRGVVFRFAMTAVLLAPEDAAGDIATFRVCSEYRNKIHGRLKLEDKPPHDDAYNLLRKYARLSERHL